MAISSLSITSVNLYAAAAEARPRRERDACESHGCESSSQWKPKERGGVLADAMLGALQSLGWTRPDVDEAASAPSAAAGDSASTASKATSIEDAVAEFAHALAGALRDLRRGEHGDGHGRGHAHGHERGYRGIAPRLELLVVQVEAAAPAKPEPAAEPADAPAPVSTSLPVPALEVDATPPAVQEPLVANDVVDAEAEVEPLNVAPAPAPQEAGGLVDAFSRLLDSLRDNGLKPPLEESASESLARFLKALADGVKSGAPGWRYDPMPVFSGTFVRLTA